MSLFLCLPKFLNVFYGVFRGALITNQDGLSRKIQDVIRAAYNLDIKYSLCERFTPDSIFIQMNGDCGISFNDNSMELEVSPECFVITIYPEITYFGSVEDYT